MMNLIKKNIVANFAGNFWQALMGVIFIPFYIKFVGIESWGLIGIYSILHQSMSGFLDIGLGNALTREIARLSVLPHKEQEMRNLVHTLEVIYWCIAIFVVIIIMLLSPFIAYHWVKAEQLSQVIIKQSILIMGFAIALQMLIGFYSGGLIGLQRQVSLNAINVSMSTLRSVGTFLTLWLFFPTIQAFFLCQIVVSAINIFLLVMALYLRLPHSEKRAVFQMQLLKGIWRFAAGMSGTTIFSAILALSDKIILSKMLPLNMFGYYTFASTLSSNLYRFIEPVFCSVYPRLIQLVSIGDSDGLKHLYHKSCQIISVLILPITVVVALFSYEILFVWTQNPEITKESYLLLSILICGTALNGLMRFPYALQLAFGWARFSFLRNVIATILFVPLIIYMTIRYGSVGAAISWLILTMGYIFFEIPLMHRRLLCDEKWRWYFQDVGLPLMVCLLTAGIGRILINGQMSLMVTLLYLTIISIFTLTITVVVVPTTRTWLISKGLSLRQIKEEK